MSHTRWDCKFHVVIIPKRRKKVMFGALRRHLPKMEATPVMLAETGSMTRLGALAILNAIAEAWVL